MTTWRIAGAGVMVAMVAAASPAAAGTGRQGMDLQGMDLQGIDLDGTAPIGVFRRKDTGALEKRGPLQHWVKVGGTWQGPYPGGFVGAGWKTELCDADGACLPARVRIADAWTDPSRTTMVDYPSNDDIWQFRIEYRVDGTGAWTNLCAPAPDGSAAASFYRGRWADDGSWSPQGTTLSCSAGVIAKCARQWGYKPWRTLRSAEHGPIDLSILHQSCVRAARADYCGDGTSYTQDGTLIDMFDGFGFNVPATDAQVEAAADALDLGDYPLEIEAFFGPHGAVSVNHERYETLTDLFADDIVLDSCSFADFEPATWDEVQTEGANLVAVRSHASLLVSMLPNPNLPIGSVPAPLP